MVFIFIRFIKTVILPQRAAVLIIAVVAVIGIHEGFPEAAAFVGAQDQGPAGEIQWGGIGQAGTPSKIAELAVVHGEQIGADLGEIAGEQGSMLGLSKTTTGRRKVKHSVLALTLHDLGNGLDGIGIAALDHGNDHLNLGVG